MSDLTRECITCHRDYEYRRSAGHRATKCSCCLQIERRIVRKKKYIAYKGGGCKICGYNKKLRPLSFHHRDPKTKEFQISAMPTISWARMKKELDKCDLLCANCHMELEEELQTRNSTVE